MPHTSEFRVATWNVAHRSVDSTRLQIQAALAARVDLLLLQEVTPLAFPLWARSFPIALFSLDGHHAGTGERHRELGCAILATGRFTPIGKPTTLAGHVAPERSLIATLGDGHLLLTVGSFHQVAGADRKKWGPAKKAQTFAAIAAWAADQAGATLFGIDANSPKVDHPDVRCNVYWHGSREGDQLEHLLFDPLRSPHQLRDALRTWLEHNPAEAERTRLEAPDGPLRVSHYNRGVARRYDHLFLTHQLQPASVAYRTDVIHERLSDHTLVIVDVTSSSL